MTADTVGGVWTYAIDLCRGLGQRGVRTTLVTMGRPLSRTQWAEASGIPALDVIETGYKLEWMQDPWHDVDRADDLLWDVASEFEPDIVHLNSYAHACLPWDIPVVVVGHSCVETWWRAVKRQATGDEWQRYREVVRRGIHAADLFVAPTQAMLSAFADAHGPHRNARVIHNGRDGRPYARAQKDTFALSAGRVWDEAKNVAALDEASRWTHCPICIAGDQTSPDGRTLNLRCRALGELSPGALASAMSRAAIYVMPARYEPFGLSVLEAAFSGCALVLSNIPTLREVWGDAALYIDPENPRQIARAINALAHDGALRSTLAAAAYRRAQHYTADAMCDRYLGAYKALLHPRAGAAGRNAVASAV